MRVGLIVLLLCLSPPAAQPAGGPADALGVQAFLDRVHALCRSAPARACFEAGWRFAAARPGRGLTLADVDRLHRRMRSWYAWREKRLSARERLSVGLGLLLADGIGAGRLHGAFDADADGIVTRGELLADVRLDRRPLGKVLADPHSVDRVGLARRLKLPPALVNGLFR